MHPNCLHYVVTEQPSVVYGNYFFATSAIQQTVVGWVHTRMLGMLITNVELVETQRILVRLMCVWALMIRCHPENCPDWPHIPQFETREGFLDILALGNLLIFMQSLADESDRGTIDLKLGVAAYTELMIWLDAHVAMQDLEGVPSRFSAAHVAFRLSAQQFGQALLGHQKFLRKNLKYYHDVPKQYRVKIRHFEPDIAKSYKEVFQDTLPPSVPGEPGDLDLIWAPPFEVKKWTGKLLLSRGFSTNMTADLPYGTTIYTAEPTHKRPVEDEQLTSSKRAK